MKSFRNRSFVDEGEAHFTVDDAFNILTQDEQKLLIEQLPLKEREDLLKRLVIKEKGKPATITLRTLLAKTPNLEGDQDSINSDNSDPVSLDQINLIENKDSLADIAISDKSINSNLDKKPEKKEGEQKGEQKEEQQTQDGNKFKTKPSLKDLPGIGQKASGFWPGVKRGAMGGLRILLIPAATSIIFGCGLFVVLAFLFKVPAAAILDKIGFKEAAKELISGNEVALAQKVALKVFDFVYGGTARNAGEYGRGLAELSRAAMGDTIKEEYVNKGKPIQPISATNLSNGIELNKGNYK